MYSMEVKCNVYRWNWEYGFHLIEQVKESGYDVYGKLWSREKYWQA